MNRLLFLPLVSVACTSSDTEDSSAADTAAPFALADIEWAACDLYTEGGGPDAECATVHPPLRVDDPDGPGRLSHLNRLGDLPGGDQRRDRARAHRLAALVDDETAIGIAVEGQAEVRGELDDGSLQVT